MKVKELIKILQDYEGFEIVVEVDNKRYPIDASQLTAEIVNDGEVINSTLSIVINKTVK